MIIRKSGPNNLLTKGCKFLVIITRETLGFSSDTFNSAWTLMPRRNLSIAHQKLLEILLYCMTSHTSLSTSISWMFFFLELFVQSLLIDDFQVRLVLFLATYPDYIPLYLDLPRAYTAYLVMPLLHTAAFSYIT